MAPRKIKIVDDQHTTDELDEQDFRRKMLEFMQQLDWKLWEIMKMMEADRASPAETEESLTPTQTETEETSELVHRRIVVDESDTDDT